MLAYLNGRIVPEEEAVVSVFDRGFLYGDGIFEAVRIYNGRPFLWDEHMSRWQEGCRLLQLVSPLSAARLREALENLVLLNNSNEAIARITLSRGTAMRGYSPKGATTPTLVIVLHPVPQPPGEPRLLKAITSNYILHERDPLAVAKHSNKLLQVLARAEADAAGADEALLPNDCGYIVEGTSSNLFWTQSGVLGTPPLRSGVLPGTTRKFVIQLANRLSIPVGEFELTPRQLRSAEGVFLTSCSLEIAALSHLDGEPLHRSPQVRKLFDAYRDTVTSG